MTVPPSKLYRPIRLPNALPKKVGNTGTLLMNTTPLTRHARIAQPGGARAPPWHSDPDAAPSLTTRCAPRRALMAPQHEGAAEGAGPPSPLRIRKALSY